MRLQMCGMNQSHQDFRFLDAIEDNIELQPFPRCLLAKPSLLLSES